jgi:HTH-type transcriptional regulator/antitoxin MqsA
MFFLRGCTATSSRLVNRHTPPRRTRRYAAAGDELVLRDRERQSKEIRRIRRKLGLSQVAAGRLTGGGHNAFSRYERGEAAPLPAVINLFRLLDKHPELLNDLV